MRLKRNEKRLMQYIANIMLIRHVEDYMCDLPGINGDIDTNPDLRLRLKICREQLKYFVEKNNTLIKTICRDVEYKKYFFRNIYHFVATRAQEEDCYIAIPGAQSTKAPEGTITILDGEIEEALDDLFDITKLLMPDIYLDLDEETFS